MKANYIRISTIILSTFLLSMCAFAQDFDCGESNSFTLREGTITEVINGNTVIFDVDDEYETQTYKVILAGVDISVNPEKTKKLLVDNLLNQKVQVIGNEVSKSKTVYGIIQPYAPNKLGDPSRYFIKNGITKYIEPEEYERAVPNYILCEYKKLEKKAKEAKLGLWKDNPGGFTFGCGECGCDGGSPSRWDIIYGKVVSVIDSDTVIVESKNKTFTIDLIGINASKNQTEVVLFLQKTILEKSVSVSVKWKTGENRKNSGVIYDNNTDKEINKHLLKYGMVAYKKINYGDLDDGEVTDCEYKKLEEKAKEAKLGIWAK